MAQVNPIVASMVPSQIRSRQSMVNPNQFGQGDWGFNLGRTPKLNWQQGVDVCSDLNFFTNDEPHKLMKNSMFGVLSNPNLISGEVNYTLNPLAQEQTNTGVNEIYKSTRVQHNMNPAGVMNFPTYQYPTRPWYTIYKGQS